MDGQHHPNTPSEQLLSESKLSFSRTAQVRFVATSPEHPKCPLASRFTLTIHFQLCNDPTKPTCAQENSEGQIPQRSFT